jgi:hypothetical protein
MEPPALGACSVPTLVLIVPSLRFRPSVCLEATVDRTLCRGGALRHLTEVTSLTPAWRFGWVLDVKLPTTALKRSVASFGGEGGDVLPGQRQ